MFSSYRLPWNKFKPHAWIPVRLAHITRLSDLFQPLSIAPTNQDNSGKTDDAVSRSQKLLLETGMVSPGSAPGTFNLHPLFMRSVEKLTKLIDDELRTIRCQKISLPSLQDASMWKSTNRWSLMGSEMLKFQDRLERHCCLGPTSEEAVTSLVATHMHNASYKKFPLRLYQIGPKFRDEMKPKYGLLRAREFIMKYSRKLGANFVGQDGKSNSLVMGCFGIGVTRLIAACIEVISSGDRIRWPLAISPYGICVITPKDASMWKSTNRWSLMGSEILKFQDRLERHCCLGPTSEEAVTSLVATHMHNASYKKFPLRLYQIGPKFRDEMKPKYGLLRAREFIMKDLYTFDTSEENAKISYDAVVSAYENLFARLQVPFVKAEASSGAMGGTKSHEFLLPCESLGEDTLRVCTKCGATFNAEIKANQGAACSACSSTTELDTVKAIEVAHSFLLGTQYSRKLGANFVGQDGKSNSLVMGCFGIGVTRLIAACIEVISSGDRIRWPLAISPYGICVITPKAGSKEASAGGLLAMQAAVKLDQLPQGNGEVVVDDRDDLTIGRRLKDAQKSGYPMIVVVGKTALDEVPKIEMHYQEGDQDRSMILSLDELLDLFRAEEPALDSTNNDPNSVRL
ncbi:putative proline--tRNA ligase, mitochondrial [Hypsibius exemplaris]|uniref:Probable proline--tRNA ligase, mitochondrial n=1 Tax=Hypsibius exemplaris TaxID=2072580 RepID=A0A9X6NC97_HYPEX|nr:putative proline--tRNA ligase, mitochondrial [Hypsibius exemplaris]